MKSVCYSGKKCNVWSDPMITTLRCGARDRREVSKALPVVHERTPFVKLQLRVHMKKYCERAWQSVDTWLAIGNIGEMDTNLGENEEDECIGGSHISADSLLLGNGWNWRVLSTINQFVNFHTNKSHTVYPEAPLSLVLHCRSRIPYWIIEACIYLCAVSNHGRWAFIDAEITVMW